MCTSSRQQEKLIRDLHTRDLRTQPVQSLHCITEETEAQGVCYLPKVTKVVSVRGKEAN